MLSLSFVWMVLQAQQIHRDKGTLGSMLHYLRCQHFAHDSPNFTHKQHEILLNPSLLTLFPVPLRFERTSLGSVWRGSHALSLDGVGCTQEMNRGWKQKIAQANYSEPGLFREAS
jgi:hypothetical protein